MTFPDTALSSTACQSTTPCNAGGAGAIVALTGTTGVGIALSECNNVSGLICDSTQTVEKSREILTWRQSADNGRTVRGDRNRDAPAIRDVAAITLSSGLSARFSPGHDGVG